MREKTGAVEGYLTGLSLEFERLQEKIFELEEELRILRQQNEELQELLASFEEEPEEKGLFGRFFRKKSRLTEAEAQTNPLDAKQVRRALEEEEEESFEEDLRRALESGTEEELYRSLIAYLETSPKEEELLMILEESWRHVDAKSLRVLLTLLSDEILHPLMKTHRGTWSLLRHHTMEVQNQWRGAKHLFLIDDESARLHLQGLLDQMLKTGAYKSLRTKERDLFAEMALFLLHLGPSERTEELLVSLSKDEAPLFEALLLYPLEDRAGRELAKALEERSWDNRRKSLEGVISHSLTTAFLEGLREREKDPS